MDRFQASASPNESTIIQLDHDASKKRKWEDPHIGGIPEKSYRLESARSSLFEIELHLETPLPFEWLRCLDVQSGQIHFYNTRTHKRTSRDPRKDPEPSSPDHHHMSLDLELNLPCESQRKSHARDRLPKEHSNSGSSILGLGDLLKDCSREYNKNPSRGLTRYPSWLAFESEQQEMVAAVCTRCHLLVMLCKSSPACPNCKFVHPPDKNRHETVQAGT